MQYKKTQTMSYLTTQRRGRAMLRMREQVPFGRQYPLPAVCGDLLCVLALVLQPQHRCECASVQHLGVLLQKETEALARTTGNIDAPR